MALPYAVIFRLLILELYPTNSRAVSGQERLRGDQGSDLFCTLTSPGIVQSEAKALLEIDEWINSFPCRNPGLYSGSRFSMKHSCSGLTIDMIPT